MTTWIKRSEIFLFTTYKVLYIKNISLFPIFLIFPISGQRVRRFTVKQRTLWLEPVRRFNVKRRTLWLEVGNISFWIFGHNFKKLGKWEIEKQF